MPAMPTKTATLSVPLPATGLAAVVFDWAGTVLDFGSLAPMGAFVWLFKRHGVPITIDEARVPMGLPKWDHIRALGRQPRIAAAWLDRKGRPFDDRDVDALYEEFTPMNAAAVREHAELIPGVAEVIRALRARGIRVGSTTGYNRPIMEVLAPLAAGRGFAPDNLVCAGDVPQNRPSPLGMYRCFLDLGVWPAHRVLKVDDTVPGLLEGRHAGCWTVGITATGNAMGLTEAEWTALGAAERHTRLVAAEATLGEARADFLLPSVADLMPLVDEIGHRLARGERPGRVD